MQSTPHSSDHAELMIAVTLVNHDLLKEAGSTVGSNHSCYLLIGDLENNALCKQKIMYVKY